MAWKPQGLPANFYSTLGTRPLAGSLTLKRTDTISGSAKTAARSQRVSEINEVTDRYPRPLAQAASVIPPPQPYTNPTMGNRGRPPHPDILTPREWQGLAPLPR